MAALRPIQARKRAIRIRARPTLRRARHPSRLDPPRRLPHWARRELESGESGVRLGRDGGPGQGCEEGGIGGVEYVLGGDGGEEGGHGQWGLLLPRCGAAEAVQGDGESEVGGGALGLDGEGVGELEASKCLSDGSDGQSLFRFWHVCLVDFVSKCARVFVYVCSSSSVLHGFDV